MDKACFLKVGCMPQKGCRPLRLPMDHDSFAPFVVAIFESKSEDNSGGMKITVGNDSYKQRPNTACIKSMEFGHMDKPQAILQIVDEAGGEFGLFVDALRKCGATNVASAVMQLKFGWVKSNCEGFGEQDTITFDGYIKMMMPQVEVSYGEGLIRYTIQATAIDAVTTNQRKDETYGKAMRLTDAINKICEKNEINVVYASVMADGSVKKTYEWPPGLSAEEAPWVWNVGGTDGPKGSWQGDNNDVLSTISNWITPYRTNDDKGIMMTFASMDYEELWLWQDPKIKTTCTTYEAGQKSSDKRGSLGTFIVNGGKCSPVIRFDPKINFLQAQAARSTGGNPSGAENSAPVRPSDPGTAKTDGSCPQDKNIGPENQATITQNAKENYPPDIVHKETLKSNMAHIEANMLTEFNISEIQAELTTIGMPTQEFVDHKLFQQAPVSIIVMNPFHISGDRNGGCGDWSWLASSGCNEVLSDNQYRCEGVNHSIKEGSYTTTLKVRSTNAIRYSV